MTVADDADFVIVGTGAAGAAAARVLTGAGASVVMIEEGSEVPAGRLGGGTVDSLGRLMRDGGGQVTSGALKIPLLQAACVGGSTVVNSGIMWRIPPWIYDRWVEEFGLGEALPARELDACFELLERELLVRPTAQDRIGGNGAALRDGAARLAWEAKPTDRSEQDCEGSARCLEGCSNGRRQSMNFSYIPRARAAGARLYADCRVTRVLPAGRDGPAAEGVFTARSGNAGARLRVRARKAVVVAASAVHSPAILQRSGLDTAGHVGPNFQGHPGVAVLGLFDRPVRLWEGATQSYEITEFRRRGIKIESLNLPPEVLAARLPGTGARLAARVAEMERVAAAAIPIRAVARGSVRAYGPFTFVRYAPEPADVALALDGLASTCEAYLAAGARAAFPGVYGLPEQVTDRAGIEALRSARVGPQAFNWVMTHMMGSCRMGADPQTSAVDFRGRPHGVRGVHVVDSSVFPTNLGVNPQLTLMAVAMVLSQRLV